MISKVSIPLLLLSLLGTNTTRPVVPAIAIPAIVKLVAPPVMGLLGSFVLANCAIGATVDILNNSGAVDSHYKNCDIIFADQSVYIPSDFGKGIIYHRGKDMYVAFNGKQHLIQRHNMDKELRCMTQKDVCDFLGGGGWVALRQSSNGDYTLHYHMRLNGGGFGLGVALGWTVRVIGYGVPVIASALAGMGITAFAPAGTLLGANMGMGLLNGGGLLVAYVAKVERIARAAQIVGCMIPAP